MKEKSEKADLKLNMEEKKKTNIMIASLLGK